MTSSSRRTVLALVLVGALALSSCSKGASTGTDQQVAPTPQSAGPEAQPVTPDPATQPAGDPSSAAYTPTGPLVADSGFRPATNGFSFENYRPPPPGAALRPDLTPDNVRKLFGDAVCVNVAGGRCALTHPRCHG